MNNDADYKKIVDDMAFKIIYEVAGLSTEEYEKSKVYEELEVALDIISSVYKVSKEQIDLDISEAMTNMNSDDIFQLKHDRNSSTLH